MVEIHKTGTGKCKLNGKECEGVFCTFSDDPMLKNVFLGWKALKQLIMLKSPVTEVKK